MTESKFRISWTVPAPIIIAILAQAFGLGAAIMAWKTTIENNLEMIRHEEKQRAEAYDSRLAVLGEREQEVASLDTTLGEREASVAALESRLSDATSALTRRLGIRQVPALVSQEGSRLRIDELALR